MPDLNEVSWAIRCITHSVPDVARRPGDRESCPNRHSLFLHLARHPQRSCATSTP